MVGESEYHERVVSYFTEKFEDAQIEHEPTLDATGREPDLLIHGDVFTFVVEIENEFESAIGGMGQALLYAEHAPKDEHWIPTVVIPSSVEPDEPEWTLIKDVVNGLRI